MSGKKDVYARAGMATIHYLTSTYHRSKINNQEDSLRCAMQQYFKMLDMDESNSLGVLGIANVLTEYGKTNEAKELYKLLQTSEIDPQVNIHAMLNNAHLLIDSAESMEVAINLY